MTGKLALIALIALSSLLLTPALATANECLNDDPDADVEWVSSGSATIAWGRTYELVAGGMARGVMRTPCGLTILTAV